MIIHILVLGLCKMVNLCLRCLQKPRATNTKEHGMHVKLLEDVLNANAFACSVIGVLI